MARTLATRKQSRAIREEMQKIRNQLPYDADRARTRLSEITSWKYHMRRRPWPILAAAGVVGYLLVPNPSRREVVVRRVGAADPHRSGETSTPTRGIVGGIAGALTSVALRSATSLASRHLADALHARSAGVPHRPPRADSDPSNGKHARS